MYLRILTVVPNYLPGYEAGGPIRTIANMVEWFGDEFTFLIITADRDLGDTQPYTDIRVNEWQRVGKAQVCYLSPPRPLFGQDAHQRPSGVCRAGRPHEEFGLCPAATAGGTRCDRVRRIRTIGRSGICCRVSRSGRKRAAPRVRDVARCGKTGGGERPVCRTSSSIAAHARRKLWPCDPGSNARAVRC